MSKNSNKETPEEQAKRLQQALRANLRRRKGQEHIPPVKKKGAV